MSWLGFGSSSYNYQVFLYDDIRIVTLSCFRNTTFYFLHRILIRIKSVMWLHFSNDFLGWSLLLFEFINDEYFFSLSSDDVRELGFTVVVDMRGGSSTWNTVKPILKILQEFFANVIHIAHIIKPDTFWQKQRTSLGSQKYVFSICWYYAS